MNPAYIVVPYYDPLVVFAPPRRGVVVSGVIGVGFGVSIGPAFAPWGWGATHFGWNQHVVIVNNAPWRRTWTNRVTYVHPYAVPRYTPSSAARLNSTARSSAALPNGKPRAPDTRRKSNTSGRMTIGAEAIARLKGSRSIPSTEGEAFPSTGLGAGSRAALL